MIFLFVIWGLTAMIASTVVPYLSAMPKSVSPTFTVCVFVTAVPPVEPPEVPVDPVGVLGSSLTGRYRNCHLPGNFQIGTYLQQRGISIQQFGQAQAMAFRNSLECIASFNLISFFCRRLNICKLVQFRFGAAEPVQVDARGAIDFIGDTLQNSLLGILPEFPILPVLGLLGHIDIRHPGRIKFKWILRYPKFIILCPGRSLAIDG